MSMLIKNITLVNPDGLQKEQDILVQGGKIEKIGKGLTCPGVQVIDGTGKTAFPGLIDMHVHLREPGYEYKEDITSFNQLYKEFQRRFVRFANTYVRDLTTAEDITIEAMMYYWENRQSLSEDSNIPAYILTIIKNKCLNYLRHQQIHEEYSDKIKDYYEWELNTRIATLQACEPYELFISEIQELVQQTLTDMPEKTRTIFMLSRYENKSYKEIAVLMNITPKGVDFHINKALKMLQTNLKDYFPLFLYFFMKCH